MGGDGRTRERIRVAAGFWPALLGWGCHGAIACIGPYLHDGQPGVQRWVLGALVHLLLVTSIVAPIGAFVVAYRYRGRFEPGEGCGVLLINSSSVIGLGFSVATLFVLP